MPSIIDNLSDNSNLTELNYKISNILRDAMQYNTKIKKLEARKGREDGGDLISVDKIQQLCDGNSYHECQCDVVALSLAYFNSRSSLKAECAFTKSHVFSFLHILMYTFCNELFDKLPNEEIYLLPFNGSSVSEIRSCNSRDFRDRLGFTLNVDQSRLASMGEECIKLLGKIAKKLGDNALKTVLSSLTLSTSRSIPPEPMPESIAPSGPPPSSFASRPDIELYTPTSNERCHSLKKIFIKYLYITLFAIAAAALLACGAVALTTYFHVGTTLMLAAGFIPFLNFVGGFQISLLLGVVTFATVCAGIGTLVKKNTDCCKFKCLKDSNEYGLLQNSREETLLDQSRFKN
jgi:hypothetical protein